MRSQMPMAINESQMNERAITRTWEQAHTNFKADIRCYTDAYNDSHAHGIGEFLTVKQMWRKYCYRCWNVWERAFDLKTLNVMNYATFSHGDGNSADFYSTGPPPEYEWIMPRVGHECFYTAHGIYDGYPVT